MSVGLKINEKSTYCIDYCMDICSSAESVQFLSQVPVCLEWDANLFGWDSIEIPVTVLVLFYQTLHIICFAFDRRMTPNLLITITTLESQIKTLMYCWRVFRVASYGDRIREYTPELGLQLELILLFDFTSFGLL